mgnify:CR=1 FL=1
MEGYNNNYCIACSRCYIQCPGLITSNITLSVMMIIVPPNLCTLQEEIERKPRTLLFRVNWQNLNQGLSLWAMNTPSLFGNDKT